MEIREHVVHQVIRSLEEPTGEEPHGLTWFAVRQPGIVRYLAARCGGEGSDAMTVALFYACAIHAAFETSLGVPPPRVPSQSLERAELEVLEDDSFIDRQPALAALVASVVDNPPLPLAPTEATDVALCLAAIIHALTP